MFNPDIEAGRISASFYKSWIMAKRNFFTVFEVIFWPFIGLMSIGLMATFFLCRQILFIYSHRGDSIEYYPGVPDRYSICDAFDMWSKSIKHTFMAPIKGYHLLIGSLLFGILRSTLVFVILIILSFYAFGFDFLLPGFGRLLFFIGLFLTSASIGILVCISISGSGKGRGCGMDDHRDNDVHLRDLLSGSVLPQGVQIIANAIPLTYFLEYMRSFYGYGESNVWFGFGLGIFYLVAGIIALERLL